MSIYLLLKFISIYGENLLAFNLNVIDNPSSTKKKQKSINNSASVLPSASLRKQQQLARSLISRRSYSVSAASVDRVNSSDGEGGISAEVCSGMLAGRKPLLNGSSKNVGGSNGLKGNSLCSSSINSSDIRNCNRLFLKKYEQEMASKVWSGALVLRVEETLNLGEGSKVLEQGSGNVVDCIKEIQVNEKCDEVESIKRERQKSIHQ
jgi:hypothetical protein